MTDSADYAHQPGGPVLLIVGAGPGIGASAARRFARAGYAIGLIARNQVRLASLVGELRAAGAVAAAAEADVTADAALRRAITELRDQVGPPDVLLVSALPDVGLIKPVLDTTAADLLASAALTIGGAATAVQAVAPEMLCRAAGTLLFTTGSSALNPRAERAASGVTTAAATVYFRMLHDALAPQSVHVNHTVIVGSVGRAGRHHPGDVANHLLRQVGAGEPVTVIQ